jgi:hypothetical protein
VSSRDADQPLRIAANTAHSGRDGETPGARVDAEAGGDLAERGGQKGRHRGAGNAVMARPLYRLSGGCAREIIRRAGADGPAPVREWHAGVVNGGNGATSDAGGGTAGA